MVGNNKKFLSTVKRLSMAVLAFLTFAVPSYSDENGDIITKYYNINFLNSTNITWTEVNKAGDNTVQVNLPNNVIKYFQYTYDPNDYNTTIKDQEVQPVSVGGIYNGGAIKVKKGETVTITNTLFINNKVDVNGNELYGGALYNEGTITEINGDFIKNSISAVSGSYGGAISNGAKNRNATIGNITGNFIGNRVSKSFGGYEGLADGGAISNSYSSTIENITGDFIDNIVDGCGGAIANSYSGTIGNITGNFIKNNSNAYGGAISNSLATIRNITGTFIGNSTSDSGGAISNIGVEYSGGSTIGNITGDFIGNSARLAGGAIFNLWDATIGNITGNFIGNSAGNGGGAIVNDGIIGEQDDDGTVVGGIINSNFYNNYAPRGGAISTYRDLNIIADNGTSIFHGNYTPKGGGAKDYNAIYVDSGVYPYAPSTLTLIAKNNGIIQFDDNINGKEGYKVRLTGDLTGTIKLYNDIKNGNVIVEGVNVDFANDEIHSYNFESLNSSEDARYSIDIDFGNQTADKIITNTASTGVIVLDSINSINGDFADVDILNNRDFVVQIIQTQDDNLQLAISDELRAELDKYTGELSVINDKDIVSSTVDSNKTLYYYDNSWGVCFDTVTKDTKNDSIGVVETIISSIIIQLDTLAELMQLETNNTRNFNIVEKDYIVISDLGTATEGVVNINGDGFAIDLDNKGAVQLSNATILNLNDVTVNNGTFANIENDNANVNLDNSILNANITGGNGTVNVKNSTVAGNLTVGAVRLTEGGNVILGNVIGANTTVSGGTLAFSETTFADAGNSVTVYNSVLDFQNDKTDNYVISGLNSDSSAKYAIDVILKGSTGASDTIKTTANSTGVVTIDNINLRGQLTQDMTILVLDTTSETISISLTGELLESFAGYYHGTKTVYNISADSKNLIFDVISSVYDKSATGTISNIAHNSDIVLDATLLMC